MYHGFSLKSAFSFLMLFSFLNLSADDLLEYVNEIDGYVESRYEVLNHIRYEDYVNLVSYRTTFERNASQQVSEVILTDRNTGEYLSKKTYQYDNEVQTSMITYTYENDAWKEDKKIEYEYDIRGNQILYASYQYLNDEWVGIDKKWEKVFDNNNLCTSYKVYEWDNNHWVPFHTELTTYNGRNLPKEIITFEKEDKNASKISYTYLSGTNLLIKEEYKKWNGNSYDNAFSVTYTYDFELPISKTIDFVNASGVHENLEKYIYHYNTSDKCTKIIRYLWEANTWQEIATINIEYVDNEIFVEEVTKTDTSKWKYDDSNGYSIYQMNNQNWEGINQYIYTNNHTENFNNKIIIYDWQTDNWSPNISSMLEWRTEDNEGTMRFTFYEKALNKVSNQNMITREVIFNFDKDTTTEKLTPGSHSFVLYPNPVKDVLNIRIKDFSGTPLYSIYSASGRMLTRGTIYNAHEVIDMTSFPSGQYIFTLNINGKMSSSVILKF
ncbi:MAG: T9SS type A sorting domain-containing protein [Candidatus Azobacteroides sp.]|nr:T9SS type A sorting domain-containing protein [Candidatus Azobacteroides sp.]